MATLADVAHRAQVSTTTASRVLSADPQLSVPPGTRRRVHDAADDLHYVPRPRARTQRSGDGPVGVVYSFAGEQEQRDPYFAAIRHGLEAAALAQGIAITAVPVRTPGDFVVPDTAHLIAVGRLAIDATCKQASSHQIVIAVDDLPSRGTASEREGDAVVVDFHAATAAVLDHLVDAGHRRIGFIGGSADGIVDARHRAFESIAAERGVYDERSVLIGEWSPTAPDAGYELMQTALDRRRGCTAYFVASDPLAAAAMKALADRGVSVPRDVAVVGFDDTPMSAWLEPSLSTVRVPAAQMGRSAIDLLRQRRAGRTVALTVTVPTELLIRASSGPTTFRRRRRSSQE